MVALGELRPWAGNPRDNEAAVPKLKKLIETHGFAGVLIATPDGVIRAGHTRYKAVTELGWAAVPVEWKNFPSVAAAEEYALADNKSAEWAMWDHDKLGQLFLTRKDANLVALMDSTGFTKGQIRFVSESGGAVPGSLRKEYGAPPFSVLNSTLGDWPERKRQWIALGIQSEMGRPIKSGAYKNIQALRGTRGSRSLDSSMPEKSIFDPVLCELMYRWFCPAGGQILDPFAGGSVRGVVAGCLGYKYAGGDLSETQVQANRKQEAAIWGANKDLGPPPRWWVGDAAVPAPSTPAAADFIFTCPPYGTLERYSDDPADLSTMGWDNFAASYRAIIRAWAARLRPNRFAAWVVCNYREGNLGLYRDLVGLTVAAHAEAGLGFYNDAVLLTPLGTLPMRASTMFNATRKLGRGHQNVLIFCKGDPRAAAKAVKGGAG